MREREKERNELILFVFQMYKLKAHYFFFSYFTKLHRELIKTIKIRIEYIIS